VAKSRFLAAKITRLLSKCGGASIAILLDAADGFYIMKKRMSMRQ
jgi:hypothetical protein